MRKLALGALIGLSISSLVMGAPQGKTYRSLTWETFKASGPELKQIGWIATRRASEIESSDWSIGCETLDRDQAKFSVYKDYVGELGAKHARLQSGWAKCEKEKGVYDFAWLDECVYGLDEQGVKPWICLCYGNPIYKSTIHLGSTLAPIVHSEEGMAAWLKYVEATVARYKEVVREWEIWNEPFGQGKDYSVLVLATAEVIKRTQPDAVILATAITDADRTVVLEALKTAAKLDLVDYWAYHPYAPNPDTSYAAVERMKQEVTAYSPKYRLYQGEVGCPSILEWTHALAFYPWTEYSQAKWDLRRMAGDRVRSIPSNVFTIIDLKYPNMLQSFGLIRSNLLHEFIYKRPAYYAVQHMMSFFDDAVKSVGILEYESKSPRKLTIAGFEKAGTAVALLWYSDQVPSDELAWDRVDLTVKGVTFHDPVYVEMITGKVFDLDKSAWKSEGGNTTLTQLPMWDSPMMLAERAQVDLRKEGLPVSRSN
ncbi:MAG: glycoside hydrolase [Rhodopirellula sp.]|nr:glycoside hydrolase [Rhodopirellula sp.]